MRPRAALLVCVAVTASACRAPRPASSSGARADAHRVSSNIVRADYAGSQACAACHRQLFETWKRSPMHLMTRDPATATIRAPFDGRTFTFMGDTARLDQHDGARFMSLTSAAFGDHTYRITRIIGGHHREDFAGVETGAAGGAGDELLLPVSYVFESSALRLKGYSVMVGERSGLRAGGVWSQTCVFCHNTVPLFDATWGALYGHGAPGYQGEVVDRLLPPERRFRFEITDAARLSDAVADETRFVEGFGDGSGDGSGGGSAGDFVGGFAGSSAGGAVAGGDAREQLGRGMHELRERFGAKHFVELGIGCESCHGGSRAHVDDPRTLPDFAPRSPFLQARAPAGWGEVTRAQWINRACARCHQVLFSRYPYTWEGGQRRGADAGGSSITSGEARD
ncbi:MAG: hypothetical protein JWM82_4410, partial [Myxococcales bacterium]|nr:hypothetical protein [Myxococcales bacterium]